MSDFDFYCDERSRRIEEMGYGLKPRRGLRGRALRIASREAAGMDLRNEDQDEIRRRNEPRGETPEDKK